MCVADFCLRHQLQVPYRIHESPDPKKLMNLRSFLQHYGLSLEARISLAHMIMQA